MRKRRDDLTNPDEWWAHYAPEYESRTWLDSRSLLSAAIAHAPAPPLVDVGCGYGFLVEAARRFGMDATGLEASPAALTEAQRLHPLADVRQWSAHEALPFDDDSVGVFVLNEVVDHFSMADNVHLFSEMRRCLVMQGVLIVRSPSRYNRYDDDRGHISFFSPREFRLFVERAGFQIEEQPFVTMPLFGGGAVARRLVRLLYAITRSERLAARIDLVARKTTTG